MAKTKALPRKWRIAEQLGDFRIGDRSGPSWKAGLPCPFQVFANEDTAENTARALALHLGGLWSVARCGNCKMLHVRSTR